MLKHGGRTQGGLKSAFRSLRIALPENDLRCLGFTAGASPGYPRLVRVVLQRVSQAQVTIDGVVKGKMNSGLLVLAAMEEADTSDDIAWLSGKIVRLRIFNDDQGVMNRSVQEIGGGVLVISQFTLFASTRKGNRPSYSRSARPEVAIPLYNQLVAQLSADLGRPVETGEFGADMQVSLTNDGPVTIIIDSKERE
jgi:D-tyrosyl-tRNA(Tyr) deacylase